MKFAAALALLLAAGGPSRQAPLPETRVTVTLPAGWQGAAMGRLLLFATPATAVNAKADEVDTSPFDPQSVWVAGRDVAGFGPTHSAVIDTAEDSFPTSFATLPAGQYRVQAVLDRNADYAYGGRGPGDLVSKVVTLQWPPRDGAIISLDHALPAIGTWDFPDVPADARARIAAARAHLDEVIFPSRVLSAFSGRATAIRAWVLRPPDYDPAAARTWPTVFEIGGFGSTHRRDLEMASRIWALEAEGTIPPMLWVFLDHSGATGTTEFADSVNNGPWGEALTSELIPVLERRWRMDARASSRFLTGHSSGGWATLWLQVRYPKIFGGTWSTSPDPSDFHDFTGADLYAPNANFYVDATGQPRPLIRDKGRIIATIHDFARLEAVLGHDGGQFRSFEWVFSPRGEDGRPMPMFDRVTGAVDPHVVAYWREHYDIAHLLETRWPSLKPDLDSKIHLFVGTADTFYLDGAAHRLDAVLHALGAHAQFVYLPGKTHFDLFARDGDPQALTKDNARAMYAIARPGIAATPGFRETAAPVRQPASPAPATVP